MAVLDWTVYGMCGERKAQDYEAPINGGDPFEVVVQLAGRSSRNVQEGGTPFEISRPLGNFPWVVQGKIQSRAAEL